jgi:hypothetical protein
MRLPKSKSGKILHHCRDLVKSEISALHKQGDFTSEVVKKKLATVDAYTKRIHRRLQKEDSNAQTGLFMMSDLRTVIAFRENGRIVNGKFVGDIDHAKLNLEVGRLVTRILWARMTKGHEKLIQGMWVEMDVY